MEPTLKTTTLVVVATLVDAHAAGFHSAHDNPFGVRTVRFDPDHGFRLNGRRTVR